MSDHRDTAGHYRGIFEEIDEARMTAMMYDQNDEAILVRLRYEVCPTCDGKGSHVNPSIDAHGISPEEFAEDPDFVESYFRGDYDVPCHLCHGKRVSLTVDEATNAQEVIDLVHARQQEAWEAAAQETREREMSY
jgi:excinuclease UvrABC ATPase subunit